MRFILPINRIHTLVFLLLAVFAFRISSQENIDLLHRSPKIPKCSSEVQVFLATKGPLTETIKAWIFFTDKGVATEKAFREAVVEMKSMFPQRTLNRRAKVRSAQKLIDFQDLNICKQYIHQVLQTGARHRATSRWFNAISVEATREQIKVIENFPFVREIRKVSGFRRTKVPTKAPEPFHKDSSSQNYDLDYGPSLGQLKQINVHILHELGYSGEGVLVCMLDTGFRKIHQALQHLTIVAEHDFVFKDDDTQQDFFNPEDYSDAHGTATWSILAGFKEGQLIGPAYRASFLLAKTEDIRSETPIEEDYWVAGIEWADSLGAQVVSSSLGYTDWYTFEDMDGNTALTTIAADRAAGLGIVVVTAAGNERWEPWGHIVAPADGDSVIAVGAVNILGDLASFSSPGPTFDGRIKPEVCALGYETFCASNERRDSYMYASGTSLSTPLVAGAIALLLEIHPGWTPMQIREALKNMASQSDHPDNDYGWGIINAFRAADLDVAFLTLYNFEIDDDSSGFSFGNGNGYAEPGEAIELSISIFNEGDAEASEVSVILRTFDEYVRLIDSTAYYDNIGAEAQKTLSFVIEISSDAPAGHEAILNLVMTDRDGQMWQDEFILTIWAPGWIVTWSPAELVWQGHSHSMEPRICADSQDILHLVWLEEIDEYRDDVFYCRKENNSWSAPINLSRTVTRAEFPRITTSLDLVYVLWQEGVGWPNGYMRTWNGHSWSEIQQVTRNQFKGGGWELDLGGSTGVLYLVAEVFSYSLADIYLFEYHGGQWRQDATAHDGFNPCLFAEKRGTKVHVAWITEGNRAVYAYSTSEKGKRKWSNPICISSSSGWAYYPQIVVTADGVRHIVWLEDIDRDLWADAVMHSFSSDGVNWSHPEQISSPIIGEVFNASLCADPEGHLHLVWPEGIPFDFLKLYYSQFDGHTWSPKVVVCPELQGAFYYSSLNIDGSGRLHLVFGNNSTGNMNVYYTSSKSVFSSVKDRNIEQMINSFYLSQNYPNPFNSQTSFHFYLPRASLIEIEVFNILGEKVCTLTRAYRQEGTHWVSWDGKNSRNEQVASGLYFYQIKAGEFVNHKKMLLLR